MMFGLRRTASVLAHAASSFLAIHFVGGNVRYAEIGAIFVYWPPHAMCIGFLRPNVNESVS
jgi:hypothetical protein